MKKNTTQSANTYCPQIWDATDLYAAMREHGDKTAFRYIEGGKAKEMSYKTFCDHILEWPQA